LSGEAWVRVPVPVGVADALAALGSVIGDFSLDLASCAQSLPGTAIAIAATASDENLTRVQGSDGSEYMAKKACGGSKNASHGKAQGRIHSTKPAAHASIAGMVSAPAKVPDSRSRCSWAGTDLAYIHYHDTEWGFPSWDDQHLFEMLVLESMQSGLSWITILRKRENFRRAFSNFDIAAVAKYNATKIDKLLADSGIVRNRKKIEAAIANARAARRVIAEAGSLADFLWSTIGNRPLVNRWKSLSEVPAVTDESRRLAAELKKREFQFLGPTTCYAFMQAVGMVNDHLVGCFRYRELAGKR
jgi:DNA-3-methyladenine glycosylase I